MNTSGTIESVAIFSLFVVAVLWLSFYFARRATSAAGYFAAGGQIHWAVNGISFAGDYLSAASFLGICGMIAALGYDGFLYSIGYLAGWIVALFVVAEPMKRLGKYTFTDALDANFNHRGIKLAAGISTLVVSIFYLIPQMVGAGVLVEPLLGLPHYVGVTLVGAIVITIVATAGMTSTTYVQFIKGGLLIIFSTVVVVAILVRGLSTDPDSLTDDEGNRQLFEPRTVQGALQEGRFIADGFSYVESWTLSNKDGVAIDDNADGQADLMLVKLMDGDKPGWWKVAARGEGQAVALMETQWKSDSLVNGTADGEFGPVGRIVELEGMDAQAGKEGTGPLSPFGFLAKLTSPETKVEQWRKVNIEDAAGGAVAVYYPVVVAGAEIMKPGAKFKVKKPIQKLNFISLMLALFLGTAALPHILIRYYTVPSPACARKSTIVAIAAIGFFYVLTLFMGLGAATNGALNPLTSNMAAPLLALSFNSFLFAIISAVAFATVLGTVSGLIVAASGAVAHDLMDRWADMNMSDATKVKAGKISAFAVGLIAIVLGILFQGMNVSFLVGWAFAVAASANLPAIIMMLFWKKTTAQGIVASIVVGIVAALGIILTGPDMFSGPYGMTAKDALHPLGQPGIISIPLSFATLMVVSLFTQVDKSLAEDMPASSGA